MIPEPSHTLRTPSPISSLACSPSGHIFAGSVDGIVRVYHQSGSKVVKAISGLGCEISSIFSSTDGAELGIIWLACGRRMLSFQLHSQEMILTLADANATLDVGTNEDDVLNELALSGDRKYIAYSLDSGVVGVVDLSTQKVSKMKTKHDSICGTIKFIPDRPSELVSGGYDQALLHFDFLQCKLVSRRNLAALPFVGGMSLSPPFVVSTAMSSTGILAAGTADGRLWLGFGGERYLASPSKKRRSRKWAGLREADELMIHVAEGPVVALAFTGPRMLIMCTLLGKTTQYHMCRDEVQGTMELRQAWSIDTRDVKKVNSMVLNDKLIAIGGLGEGGEGVIEVWDANTN